MNLRKIKYCLLIVFLSFSGLFALPQNSSGTIHIIAWGGLTYSSSDTIESYAKAVNSGISDGSTGTYSSFQNEGTDEIGYGIDAYYNLFQNLSLGGSVSSLTANKKSGTAIRRFVDAQALERDHSQELSYIPVLAMIRLTLFWNLYIGGGAGYSFISGNAKYNDRYVGGATGTPTSLSIDHSGSEFTYAATAGFDFFIGPVSFGPHFKLINTTTTNTQSMLLGFSIGAIF